MDEPLDGRAGITAELVSRLIAAQAPRWSGRTVRPVPVDGWDNRTYRLGVDLTVRLPTAAHYVAAVAKEDRWLPALAPRLPLPVPEPVFTGRPGPGYPYPWSVRRWLPGDPATLDRIADPVAFAAGVGEFLVALRAIDPTGGPPAGVHSFHRGASPAVYDEETRRHLGVLGDRHSVDRATRVWDEAIGAGPAGPVRWFHGDLAAGNLLVHDGSLAAVIDFGTCGVGDPACDLVLAWTLLSGPSRRRFAEVVDQDAATWARARGWALWKALISISEDAVASAPHRHVVEEVLTDPVGPRG